MTEMPHPNHAMPGTVASVAMALDGRGHLPSVGSSLPMGHFIQKTSPHFSPPRMWQQGIADPGSANMWNYAEGLPIVYPMKSSTPEATSETPFRPMNLGPEIQALGSRPQLLGKLETFIRQCPRSALFQTYKIRTFSYWGTGASCSQVVDSECSKQESSGYEWCQAFCSHVSSWGIHSEPGSQWAIRANGESIWSNLKSCVNRGDGRNWTASGIPKRDGG